MGDRQSVSSLVFLNSIAWHGKACHDHQLHIVCIFLFPLSILTTILLLQGFCGAAWCKGKLVRVSHYVASMTRN